MQLDYQGTLPDPTVSQGTLLAIDDVHVSETYSHTPSKCCAGGEVTPFRQASRPLGFQMFDCRSYRRVNVNTPILRVSAEFRTSIVRSTKDSAVTEKLEADATLVVYPKAASRFLGITCGLMISTKATSGWQYSLQPFRAVEETALVFEFCREGNLEGLRCLFKRNEASPWDRDPQGQTPLLVKLLITRDTNIPS